MYTNTPSVEGRQEAWEDMIADERQLLLNKGADYTAGQKDSDAYANFRIISGLMAGAPVTPYTIAMVYALKHVLSLITFAKTGKQESGEGLRGRHMDARNYFFILNELVPDHVNHFEQYDDSDWWSDEANDLFTEATQESDEYPTIITEDPISGTVKYLDEADHDWHPISELEKRKEVNNTTLNGSLAACSGDCCCCIGSLVEIGDLRDKR